MQMGEAPQRAPAGDLPGVAEQTAAYRLLSNEAVRMEHILDSHIEQTVELCRAAGRTR